MIGCVAADMGVTPVARAPWSHAAHVSNEIGIHKAWPSLCAGGDAVHPAPAAPIEDSALQGFVSCLSNREAEIAADFWHRIPHGETLLSQTIFPGRRRDG